MRLGIKRGGGKWGSSFFKSKRVYSPLDILTFRVSLGISRFNKKRHSQPLKIAMGGVLVGVGVLTFPLPCGSLVMIAGGRRLIVMGGFDFWGWLRNGKGRLSFLFWKFGGVGLMAFIIRRGGRNNNIYFYDMKGGIKK